MEKHSFIVKESDEGMRLDKFLVQHLSGDISRTFIQRLIKRLRVRVDGAPSKAHHTVVEREVVDVEIPDPEHSAAGPEAMGLDVVYEDDDLVVVDKPPGMVVHPAPGHRSGTLVNALLHHCKGTLSGIGGILRPGIVHRIDKGTSGLLVVAKNDNAHHDLVRQFKARTIKRTYVAIVKGALELDRGTIELPIGRHRRDRKKMDVVFTKSKSAVTRYRVLRRFKDSTLLELQLGTGRTHQIRVHMEHLGHPIVGDEKYGTKGMLGRPALHAKTLGFVHPRTHRAMEFDAQVPEDMQDFIKARS